MSDTHAYDPRREESKLGEGYGVTARELLTPDPHTFAPTDDAVAARRVLVERDYDAAPVADPDDNRLVGYLDRARLGNDADGPVDDHRIAVTDRHRIAPDAPFADVLVGLSNFRFLFAMRDDEAVGILTRYDLNSLPAYVHIYGEIGRLEVALRNRIRAVPQWQDKTDVKVPMRTELRDVAFDRLSCAPLSMLYDVAGDVGELDDLPTDQFPEAIDTDAVERLRNNVAHYNPIVHTMDDLAPSSDYNNNVRTAHDLRELYAFIQECLDATT